MSAPSVSGRGLRHLQWSGDVEIERAPEVRRELLQALAQGESVVVDLGAVRRLDTAGIAVLVEALHKARAAGLNLRLTQAGDAVGRMLKLTRLDDLIEIDR
ncbi:STAS domain-containing protein [Panacagrimonas sp.]|uniref:STAS domain-containing protein n=1 Tax=Panacagrimonas sp. TaxID=2480088 RepID=UPI003B523A9F